MTEGEQDPGLPTQSIWDIPFEDLVFKETIGKGSFGSVFKGNYLGVDVAIKKIEKADDPEYLKYIDREVSMLQSIRHPFIVQFSGICVHSTGLYIITEFVSGGDVRKLLKVNPSLSWKKKVRISIDLAKAMLFLHSKKIIHRDLKSKNILLDEHGKIRLCDFGFARMTESKRNKHMTMCGTEGWVAPEILLGMSYDTSCDVFSYGVVVAELITGKKPGVDLWIRTPDNCFDINPDELRTKALPGCPPRFLEMCIECCQYEPLLRPKFEDILHMLNSIENAIPEDADRLQQQYIQQQHAQEQQQLQQHLTPAQYQQHQKQQHRPSQPQPVATPPRNTQQIAAQRTASEDGSGSTWKMAAKSFKKPVQSSLSTSPPPPQPAKATPKNNSYQVPRHSRSLTKSFLCASRLRLKKAQFKVDSGPVWMYEQGQPQASAVNMHLIKMVERATTDYYYDVQYIHDLLLSFRCFTTPNNLFELLIQRYAATPPLGGTTSDIESWNKSQKVIQLRVIIFIKRWIDGYHKDFDEPGMEEMLTNFDKVVAVDEANANHGQASKDSDIRFTALLQRKRGATPILSPSNTPHYPAPWFPASMETLEIADVQAMELARQISLHQSTLFTAIHPREYLQYCAERGGAKGSCWVTASGTPESHTLSDEVAPNLHAFARWSRALGRLVASDIVKHEAKSKRVASLEKWIDVANNCLQLKNFDAVFNIMDGIRHPSIERLSETFKGISTSSQKTLDALRTAVSKDGDFKHYREALSVSPPPTLPYFESVLEEMWFLECSSPKVLNGGIVNFFHYRQISRKVFTYQQCLPTPYLFKPVPPLQKMLNRPANELLDDEQLKRKSLSREEPAYY
eukprot:Phypoly_transcript_02579.p1 GENE.Phypoly_transcript_02579~~Phypoly_transcript_02579.p1  ORF type:complete len:852 (-),score=144.64 Phypoly_transcript_02579:66-2621(-)